MQLEEHPLFRLAEPRMEVLSAPGDAPCTVGPGSPIVPGRPKSVYAPVDAKWFNLLALIGGIGALIATELGVAGQFALHL